MFSNDDSYNRKESIIQGSENMQILIQQSLFTDFRPIFIVMVAILAIFLLLSMIPQGDKGVSFGTVLLVSGIHIILGGMLFYTESELIQTLNLTADDLTLYLFIAIMVLSILNQNMVTLYLYNYHSTLVLQIP